MQEEVIFFIFSFSQGEISKNSSLRTLAVGPGGFNKALAVEKNHINPIAPRSFNSIALLLVAQWLVFWCA